MTRHRCDIAGEQGYALIYMTFILTDLLLFSGLAVDTGRAYVVQAQLSKAVDGAALGAARILNSGDPRGEARRIFKANFPDGYLGTTWVTDPTTDPGFFTLETIHATGVNVVTVAATAKLPTTFMSLANFDDVTVEQLRRSDAAHGGSQPRARRLELDRRPLASGPGCRTHVRPVFRRCQRPALARHVRQRRQGGRSDAVQLAASTRVKVVSDIPNTLPGGSTAMVEGLYRGWDELRSVSSGQQSGLRVIVLFTDGASNSVPGLYDVAPGSAKGLRTADFPKIFPIPDNQT